MGTDKKLLFGIDDSDFSMNALSKVGNLQKNNTDLKIAIFHGAGNPNCPFMKKVFKLSPDEMEKHIQLHQQEEENILKISQNALIESGFDPKRVTTIFEQACSYPSESMMKLASTQSFETVAVARWGTATLSRQAMGPVPYRLANSADIPVVWIMDPRVSSQDILVTLVGAPVSQRVMDYTLRYFSHLKESRFTFLHVVPPLPYQCWDYGCIIDRDNFEKQQTKIYRWIEEENKKVSQIMDEGRQNLIKAGVPDQNITLKLKHQEQGITRDILKELKMGDYGILIMGRKGSKKNREFSIGSRANKLIHAARTLLTCMVC